MEPKTRFKIDNKFVIKFMLYFLCFERLLESIGFPHMIIFILDIANIYLLINMAYPIKAVRINRTPILTTQLIMIIVGMCIAVINGVNFSLILWAIRNLCRFWIFFAACEKYLREKDVRDIFKAFKIVFNINLLIMVIQFVMGFRGDYLGGIFGTSNGANAYCNVFFLVVCTFDIVNWFEGKEKTGNLLYTLLAALAIAAITETKIFFVEIVLIFLIVFALVCIIEGKTRMLLKAIGIAMLGMVGLIIFVRVMIIMYPNFADFFTIKGFLYHTTRESGYSGAGDLNRLTAIKTINKTIFDGSALQRFLGLGLGSTEYGSAQMLTSAFYKKYEYLHYFWFSHAWMYLENGYFGLIIYILGFLLNGLLGIRKVKRYKYACIDTRILMTGIVLSFMTLILYLYNQSLRLEAAYWLYFCLGVMNIGRKSCQKK